jgi:hypothetical protein
MSRISPIRKSLIALCVFLLLPLQSIAASAMQLCAAHHQANGAVSQVESEKQKPSVSNVLKVGKCLHCAMCGGVAMLPTILISSNEQPSTYPVPVYSAGTYTEFHPSGLERPPRNILS